MEPVVGLVPRYSQGGWKVVVVAAVLVLMQLLMMAGRLLARNMKKARIMSDDVLLIVGAILTLVLCIFAIISKRQSVANPADGRSPGGRHNVDGSAVAGRASGMYRAASDAMLKLAVFCVEYHLWTGHRSDQMGHPAALHASFHHHQPFLRRHCLAHGHGHHRHGRC